MVEKDIIRPYWHVDAKWIFGILATFFLTLSLLLYVLANLTSEKTFIPLATLVVASQFSRDGLDDPREIEETKRKYLNSGEDVFYPLGNKNVKITRAELETLSPREIRLRIFRQVVEPYYYEGAEGVANRTTATPKQKEQIKKQAGLLSFANKKTHQTFFTFFLISVIPVVLAFTGLIYFSYRYGKLISPAVVLLLVTTLPSLFFLVLANARQRGADPGPFPILPTDITRELGVTIGQPYYALFLVGIALISAVVLLKLFKKVSRKNSE